MRKELEPKLRKAINGIVSPHLRDDVMQEVLIRLWQLEMEKPNEDISGLAMAVARRTARRVSMRALKGQSPWTGSPTQVGKTRGEVRIIHGDMPMNEDQQVWDHFDFAVETDDYSDVEIRVVIESLLPEDRELVIMRFWDRMTNKEIAVKLGTTEWAVEKRWAKRIKPQLVEALSV
jgi:RNA polymerase sigma factor (sigma-70 family)